MRRESKSSSKIGIRLLYGLAVVIGGLLFYINTPSKFEKLPNVVITPVVDSQPKNSIVSSVEIIPKSDKPKIAYAITMTKDGPFLDGALVLGYSAKKVHDASHGFESKYDADLVAFVTPAVVTARPILEKFGWRVLERALPVTLDEIENKQYSEGMRNSGCCGADEFLKLWAYTLVEYKRVVHLDMDSIIYQNMVGFLINNKY